jgi:hypothetical protein
MSCAARRAGRQRIPVAQVANGHRRTETYVEPYTMYCIHDLVYRTSYKVHCIHDILYRILYTIHYTPYTLYMTPLQDTSTGHLYSTLCTWHFYSTLCTWHFYSTLCTWHFYSTLCTWHFYRTLLQTQNIYTQDISTHDIEIISSTHIFKGQSGNAEQILTCDIEQGLPCRT